jgi:hypothetical protein
LEDLIAKFPEHFFPEKGFVLIGRQETFSGVGRFDLLFADRHQRKNLIELKARPLKIADVDQVGAYKTALRERGEKRVIMWLISPRIPPHVRESLDDFGIEYKEIHIGEFRRIAEEHGFPLVEEINESPEEHRTRRASGADGDESAVVDHSERQMERPSTSAPEAPEAVDGISIPTAMDQAGKRLQGRYGGEPIPRQDIIREVLKRGKWDQESCSPSDYCYNLTNKGSRLARYRVFLRVAPGKYRYVGRDYPYRGPVSGNPR